MSVRIAVTTYLAGTSLQGAAHFAWLSRGLEQRSTSGPSDDVITQHRVYVIGAILLAVAALEGTINELFGDVVENPAGRAASLPESSKKRLAAVCRLQARDRTSVLKKFQMALIVTTGAEFDSANLAYQHGHALVQLRNALVHYGPKAVVTIGWDKKKSALENKLAGRFG